MGVIVLHAGMSKTGTSSIQHWLAQHVESLGERGINAVRVVQRSREAPVSVVRSTRDNAKSTPLVDGLKLTEPADIRVDALRRVLELVATEADRDGVVVISNEGYETLFQHDVPEFRQALDAVADAHTVRVAYYVRPQHGWLEAAWRQWGFRHTQQPSAWLRRQEPKIRYGRTLAIVREEAPCISFEVRPCRRDLLVGGDVVQDFAKVFLGLDDPPLAGSEDAWANRGFPLEVSILLRYAPAGAFWSSLHDNKTLDRLREFVLRWQLPETEPIARSRKILQQYCYQTFEPENLQLIEELGWQTPNFVSPVGGEWRGACAPGLDQLDELWTPHASEAEREVVFSAFRDLVGA
jgi:hypothetical protein